MLPNVPAPPLVPELSDEHLRFMFLHSRHLVVEWRWVLGGGTLVAKTERGVKAYISAEALGDLIVEGLVFQMPDSSRVDLTSQGRAYLEKRK